MLPRIARTVSRPAKQRRPGDSAAHLAMIRQLPCVVCYAAPPNDPHHLLRIGEQLPKGMSRRNEDRWAISLCREDHQGAHGHGNDEAWLAGKGIDGRALAAALWAVRGDLESMQRVVFRFHQGRDL